MPNSWQLHGLQAARLLCPWDFPVKNTGVGCRFLIQGIFPTQGSNLCLLHSLPLSHLGSSLLTLLLNHSLIYELLCLFIVLVQVSGLWQQFLYMSSSLKPLFFLNKLVTVTYFKHKSIHNCVNFSISSRCT